MDGLLEPRFQGWLWPSILVTSDNFETTTNSHGNNREHIICLDKIKHCTSRALHFAKTPRAHDVLFIFTFVFAAMRTELYWDISLARTETFPLLSS
jgi:hypothetical protein